MGRLILPAKFKKGSTGGNTGGGTTTPPPTSGDGATIETLYLPFDMPTSARLDASTKISSPHLMTQPWTRTVDDKNWATAATGYYTGSTWGPPGGVEGSTDHRQWGGMVRNRPTPRDPIGGGEAAFQLADRRWEIQQARAAGFRHFHINMQGMATYVQDRHRQCGQAAVLENALGMLIAMPDGSSQYTAAGLAAQLTDLFGGAYSSAWAKHSDGRFIVSPYGPEFVSDQTPTGVRTFWKTVMQTLASNGINACLWPCFSINWDGQTTAQAFTHADLAPWTVGLGRWGDRDPISIEGAGDGQANFIDVTQSRYGKPALYPIGMEDSRPRGQSYSECGGWNAMVSAWNIAITKNAPAIQFPTWNDWGEGSGIAPSALWGYSVLDVHAYYNVRFRLGYWPTIKRDTLYLAHRIHKAPTSSPQPTYTAGGSYNGGYRMTNRHGGTTDRDVIDVLVFATAAADVEILVNDSVVYTQAVPPGVSRVTTALQAGNISCRMKRSGAVVAGTTATSPFPVNFNSALVQDLTYRRISSRR